MTTSTATRLDQTTGTWVLDPTHTRVGFAVRHAGIATVRGSFEDVEGTLVLDADNPAASRIDATIKTASFASGNAQRDDHIRSAEFLDAETYPTLGFTSTEIRSDGDGFTLVGDLTVRDVTRPVTIDVELEGVAVDPFGNTRVGFSGETQINRKDFGLTWNVALDAGGLLVGDKVKITLDVSAVRQG